jgi:hypothetical protein
MPSSSLSGVVSRLCARREGPGSAGPFRAECVKAAPRPTFELQFLAGPSPPPSLPSHASIVAIAVG